MRALDHTPTFTGTLWNPLCWSCWSSVCVPFVLTSPQSHRVLELCWIITHRNLGLPLSVVGKGGRGARKPDTHWAPLNMENTGFHFWILPQVQRMDCRQNSGTRTLGKAAEPRHACNKRVWGYDFRMCVFFWRVHLLGCSTSATGRAYGGTLTSLWPDLCNLERLRSIFPF